MSNTGKKDDPNTHQDVVYCLNANTGREIWRHTYKCGLNFKSNTPQGPFATPTIDENRLYTFSRKGDLFCLNAQTGKVIWYVDLKEELGMKPPFQGGFAGSPLVLGELVILNAGQAGTALNKKTGKVVWKSEPEPAAQATPVPFKANGKQCVAIFSGIGIVAVNAADGRELWRFPWDTKYKTNAANPVISGGRVFISSWYKTGCALLDISTGKPKLLYKNKQMQNHYSTSILSDGYLYGFDVAKLKCMDFNTGKTIWTLTGGYGKGSLTMADKKLIVLTEKGILLIGPASPKGFRPLLQAKVINGKCYATPVYANGKIFVRNLAGDVVCLTLNTVKNKKIQARNNQFPSQQLLRPLKQRQRKLP